MGGGLETGISAPESLIKLRLVKRVFLHSKANHTASQ